MKRPQQPSAPPLHQAEFARVAAKGQHNSRNDQANNGVYNNSRDPKAASEWMTVLQIILRNVRRISDWF